MKMGGGGDLCDGVGVGVGVVSMVAWVHEESASSDTPEITQQGLSTLITITQPTN